MKNKPLTHFIVVFCLLTGAALMAYVNVERQKLIEDESIELTQKKNAQCVKTKAL